MKTKLKMVQSRSVLTLALVASCGAFVPQPQHARSVETARNGIFDKMGELFEELDAFVDDATARRLGNGSKFYGKRKSNFYGTEDSGRKDDRAIPDPTEDYQGPTSTGLFTWMPDENGQLRPVTRGKQKNIERNPNFWDKVYDKKEEEK
jgi:hypothetical protein